MKKLIDFNPSIRQQEIFDKWETTDSNILINAVAGSGKTTTLMELLKQCNDKTLFLAFNKSIKEEIELKMQKQGLGQGKAMTMHGMGFYAIRDKLKTKVKVNANIGWDIFNEISKKYRVYLRSLNGDDYLRVAYTLLDMNDISRLFFTNDIDEMFEHFKIMDKSFYDFPEIDQMWKDFLETREKFYNRRIKEIDFTDMIYLPIHKDLPIPLDPTYLMIDEAQDLNLCQHLLIDKLISQGSVKKWIAVGDRNQSIYLFGGAYSNSFDMFNEKSDNVEELPLDICYRCPKSIIDSANEVYDIMEYGIEKEGIVDEIEFIKDIKPGSMVVCRNSGPLFKLYFSLIAKGKNAYLKGDDILQRLVKFLKPYKNLSNEMAEITILQKINKLKKDRSEGARFNLAIYKENFDNFKLIRNHIGTYNDTVDTLIKKIQGLFLDKEGAIMLCTIHKSKGLENDVVYILNEHLIPSQYAKSKEQLKQEKNLKYVARTRAKKELYFLNFE